MSGQKLQTQVSHTPGPWVAPRDQVNFVTTRSAWESDQVGELKASFQCTISLNQGEDRASADARLIACAPELLDEVETLINAIERGTETPEDLEGILEYARRLVERARGSV